MRKMSLLESIRQAQKRLAALRKEVADLEEDLAKARFALLDISSGPAASEGRTKSRHGFAGGGRSKPIQPNSSVDWTLRALKASGQDMNLDEIIQFARNHGGPEIKKATLASNLSRYVKQNDTFVRTAPNTFGLLEWEAGFGQTAEERFGSEEIEH